MAEERSEEVSALRGRWMRLCEDVGVASDVAERWWGVLESHYCEPSRAYHTLSHLAEMFGYLDVHAASVTDRAAVSLAIFFHDVIYNARAGSPKNEVDSARVFEDFAQDALPPGSPPGKAKGELIEKVSRWIVQTAHHWCAPEDEEDCKLFMDFDMAVLGRAWGAYETYSKQIRQEYIHVPEAIYFSARGGFLRAFGAGSEPIFATQAFRQERESRARENAIREADVLSERFLECSFFARMSSKLALGLKAAPRKHGRALRLSALAAMAATAAAAPHLLLGAAVAGLAAGAAAAAPLLAWLACRSPFRRHPYRQIGQSGGVAVIAGSFNPPHLGHLQMIAHLSTIHDSVHAVIGVNPSKRYDVSAFERQELMRAMLQELGLTNVKVVVCSGIIWKYARSVRVSVMYRGIRSWWLDGRPEKTLEFLNLVTQLADRCWPIPTVYLQGDRQFAAVSSTLLRSRIADGQDISHLVPPGCAEAVRCAYSQK